MFETLSECRQHVHALASRCWIVAKRVSIEGTLARLPALLSKLTVVMIAPSCSSRNPCNSYFLVTCRQICTWMILKIPCSNQNPERVEVILFEKLVSAMSSLRSRPAIRNMLSVGALLAFVGFLSDGSYGVASTACGNKSVISLAHCDGNPIASSSRALYDCPYAMCPPYL